MLSFIYLPIQLGFSKIFPQNFMKHNIDTDKTGADSSISSTTMFKWIRISDICHINKLLYTLFSCIVNRLYILKHVQASTLFWINEERMIVYCYFWPYSSYLPTLKELEIKTCFWLFLNIIFIPWNYQLLVIKSSCLDSRSIQVIFVLN